MLAAALNVHAQRNVLVSSHSSAVPGKGKAAAECCDSACAKDCTKPCCAAKKTAKATFPAFGSVERLAPELDALLAPEAQMEKLAEGFDWSEGPVWLRKEQAVVFSDVPRNKVHRWSERDGLSVYLDPSGYTGHSRNDRELGSNGLATDRAGNLLLCQHGNRQIAKLVRRDGTKGVFEPVVPHFNHRRFNSPNDLVLTRKGDIYFTDPPYGLNGLNGSPLKELLFNGVYLARKSGEVVLLTSEMTFPNGIALSPDEKTLYVAQSDGNAPILRAFDVQADGTVKNGRLFFDCKPLAQKGLKGGPDGLKVDQGGNIWTSGPGVCVFGERRFGSLHRVPAISFCTRSCPVHRPAPWLKSNSLTLPRCGPNFGLSPVLRLSPIRPGPIRFVFYGNSILKWPNGRCRCWS
jgi:gluconolactonase